MLYPIDGYPSLAVIKYDRPAGHAPRAIWTTSIDPHAPGIPREAHAASIYVRSSNVDGILKCRGYSCSLPCLENLWKKECIVDSLTPDNSSMLSKHAARPHIRRYPRSFNSVGNLGRTEQYVIALLCKPFFHSRRRLYIGYGVRNLLMNIFRSGEPISWR